MKKINLLILATGLTHFLFGIIPCVGAQKLTGRERSARIDIYSEDRTFELLEVKSNGRIDFATWLPKKEDHKKSCMAQIGLDIARAKSEKDQWQELWIEFVPADSGFVFIDLKGSFYLDLKINQHQVWVDDVTVEGKGAELINGSFEEKGPLGNPAGWGPENLEYRYSINRIPAHAGNAYILVWHDRPAVQKIAVKAKEKYRISAYFKPYYAQELLPEEWIFR